LRDRNETKATASKASFGGSVDVTVDVTRARKLLRRRTDTPVLSPGQCDYPHGDLNSTQEARTKQHIKNKAPQIQAHRSLIRA
jgi:hypothetical protein